MIYVIICEERTTTHLLYFIVIIWVQIQITAETYQTLFNCLKHVMYEYTNAVLDIYTKKKHKKQ